jgi:RNA polymerase sigma-70 factor (ECF subfamily)
VFALSYPEVAQALGRTEGAVRQMAHRAREHVAARRPRFTPSPAEHLDVTRRFARACDGGSLAELLGVLAPDVVLVSDGGGVVRAARRPLTGADDVARFLVGILGKAPGTMVVDLVAVNGAPALRVRLDGAAGPVTTCVQLVVDSGLVTRVLVVANPEKLAQLEQVHPMLRR